MVVKWSLACCFDVDKKKTQVFLVLFDFHETVFAVFVFVFEQFVMFRFHFGCQLEEATSISWVRFFLLKILINYQSILTTLNGIGRFSD